jgi:NAD(P)-dependent dehydrogenase (short-subunit alcohol dehydrogenase family)
MGTLEDTKTVNPPGYDDIGVAVVTGGGHGIGRAICRHLAADGKRVVVVDLDGEAAGIVAEDVGGVARTVDVADEDAILGLVADIEASAGPIDLFVSNAGVGFGDDAGLAASAAGSIGDTADRWQVCWDVNVMAHVYAARALVPGMIERGGGWFVNIASAAGLLNQIGDAAYTATKHAAVAFAESLCITHADDGIGVALVCPQAVATRMIGIEDDSESLDGGFMGNDVDGILKPEVVAGCIVAALKERRFLVLPHPQAAGYEQRRAGDRERWIDGMRRWRRQIESN